ncbi:MAG: response regulator [Thermoanaerobaculia bacterium]
MTKTILLADDSVTIQKVVELTFMDEDFGVSAVSNGAEAIARLSESKPDVVIADVHMPGAGGFEVCRRSKELYPTVPVLLLVGTFESFDADEAMRCGADGHLKKPFDSQELMRRVRELAAAPSRSVPVPSAEPEFADEAPAAGISAADDIYAVALVGELWEPLDEASPALELAPEAPLEAAPVPFSAYEPVEMSARFAPPQQASPEPVAQPAAGPAYAPAPASEVPSAATFAGAVLSDADVDRIARRMLELVGDKAVRDVAWEVVPDLAEVLLKSRIRELESSID